MTDKEKRELKDGVISIFKRFNMLDHTATIGGLRDDILRYINSLQEEPVSERFAFKAIPRLLEMIEPTDRAKAYIAKLADTLELEGYSTDAKIVMESLKIMNGKKVAMATMDEEPVSEELETELNKYIKNHFTIDTEQLDRFGIEEKDYMYSMDKSDMLVLVEHFTNWHKTNLWKPADGEDLPECNREVIALEDDRFCGYKVVFAHRPNPNGWDGKSLSTGKVEHYTPKTYDKGGWNIPNIKYFLDVELPKEIEL